MVVFAPSGSRLPTAGEQILREGWIENGELTAVVTLPKDAFQPYSQVATHALLIEKTRQPNYINWFFQPRFDGFTSGRNRQPTLNITIYLSYRCDPRSEGNSSGYSIRHNRSGPAGCRVRFRLMKIRAFGSIGYPACNTRETCYLVDVGSGSKTASTGSIRGGQSSDDRRTNRTDRIFLFQKNLHERLTQTFLQGAYSIQLTDAGGEIRGERKNIYPLQIATQWEDAAWMGVILNADGFPAGPGVRS